MAMFGLCIHKLLHTNMAQSKQNKFQNERYAAGKVHLYFERVEYTHLCGATLTVVTRTTTARPCPVPGLRIDSTSPPFSRQLT